MDNKHLGIGIVGCGHWGVNYIRVFSELPDARVVAVCDKDHDRVRDVERRRPDLFVTSELDELSGRTEVDAVVVCTEATSHYRVAMNCLRNGKHVLIEKPMTTEVEDGEQLSAFAESNRLTLMVGHTFIYNAAVQKVKKYVDELEGRVYYMYARRTNLGPIRRDVNALWDLATHDIAIFNYLMDSPPEWVSAVGSKVLGNVREDVGFISLGYRGDVLSHVHVSWADPNKAREITVVCSDRRIVFNDLNGLEQVRIFEKGISPITTQPTTFGEFVLQVRDGDIISPKIPVSEPLKNECRHFVDCVRNGEQPRTGGAAGTEVVSALKAMDRSVALGGARVEVRAATTRSLYAPIPEPAQLSSGA